MSTPSPHPVTFGVIFGNRGFFQDHLAKSGREEIIAVLSKAGHRVPQKYAAAGARERNISPGVGLECPASRSAKAFF